MSVINVIHVLKILQILRRTGKINKEKLIVFTWMFEKIS